MLIHDPSLNTRPEAEQDCAFIENLFCTVREDLAFLPEALVQMQFRAQQSGYRQRFPAAKHMVVESEGESIGSVVVDYGAHAIRLVYIALLPHVRSLGYGRRLIGALQAEARDAGKALLLAVDKHNVRAQSLYLALGFLVDGEDETRYEMVWRNAADIQSGS